METSWLEKEQAGPPCLARRGKGASGEGGMHSTGFSVNTERFHGCRAILFDFGGTLDAEGQHWLKRFFKLYEDAGFAISRPEITRAFYHAVDTCYADPGVASFDLPALIDLHVRLQFEALGIEERRKEKRLAEKFRSDCRAALNGRLALLERMGKAFRLGIVSNFYGNLEHICREAQLSRFFEVIIDSNRVGLRKPDPGIFILALTRLSLPGPQVVFVGDSYERDMVPAMEAGMKTIWLKGPDGLDAEEEAHPVDASIGRLSDLEELLR